MVIEFRCPNGHRLNCPDERAGLPGKCPKCKATFRVPQPGGSGIERPDAPISDSGVSEPELNAPPSGSGISSGNPSNTNNLSFLGASSTSDATNLSFLNAGGPVEGHRGDSGKFANPAETADENEAPGTEPAAATAANEEATATASAATKPATKDPAAPAEERIVFLCPNGHKLNCPASMQGRPGKCPHCGATFLVPQYTAEDDEDEEDEDDSSLESDGGGDTSREQDVQQDLVEQELEGFNGDAFQGDPFAFDFSSLTTTEAVSANGMAGVFQRLWLHKRTGGIVELYLKGGEVIAPEWYSPRQSQETYGMFAFAERDGSFTMTAVSWDAIERIAVRGVSTLPQGMFDEEA